MALISRGIELYLKTVETEKGTAIPSGIGTAGANGILIPDLQEIGELVAGGAAERDKIEVTTLAHDRHEFVDGLQAESEYEGITFKLLYNPTVYDALTQFATSLLTGSADGAEQVPEWVVSIPSGGQFAIKGRYALKFDGASVNAALTMTLTITPTEPIEFAVGA